MPLEIVQDTFDHVKGQKPAIRGAVPLDFLNLVSWIVFRFSPGLLCNLVGKSLQNVPDFWRRKSAESYHVFGCHGFFGPEQCFEVVVL